MKCTNAAYEMKRRYCLINLFEADYLIYITVLLLSNQYIRYACMISFHISSCKFTQKELSDRRLQRGHYILTWCPIGETLREIFRSALPLDRPTISIFTSSCASYRRSPSNSSKRLIKECTTTNFVLRNAVSKQKSTIHKRLSLENTLWKSYLEKIYQRTKI